MRLEFGNREVSYWFETLLNTPQGDLARFRLVNHDAEDDRGHRASQNQL